jgi:cobyrinic acid a,c-diamide synthase
VPDTEGKVTVLRVPRLAVAGLSGDSGKTFASLGVARALTDRGLAVRAFKKGPDYIDAAWLAAATGRGCTNLDTFLMSPAAIGAAFGSGPAPDVALVEGNRGLYDGADEHGTHSTAELAKLLGAPVVLVVDVTKTTRTAAALVLGCRDLDPHLDLAGVILNRVGTARQEKLVRASVESATGIPVVGAVPRLRGDDPLPGRHLGLVTVTDHPAAGAAIETAARVVRDNVDLDRVLEIAASASQIELPAPIVRTGGGPCRVACLEGAAFSFYYPENLDRLRQLGAELVTVDPVSSRTLPQVDGLYIGGGFPEVHAARLADNVGLAADLRRRVASGLPVYAECGGLMYLARELRTGGATYPMAAVLDLVVEQTPRPVGHGYEVARVDRENPFFAPGTSLRGHEFHYSRVVDGEDRGGTVLAVGRGEGIGSGRDGIVRGRVWASYLHLHALGEPAWADGFLRLARDFAGERAGTTAAWG